MNALEGLTKLAVEYWRLLKLYERAVMEQPPNKHVKGKSHLHYATRQLKTVTEECGLRIMTYDGQTYTPNLPMTIINADEFNDDDKLFIDQTIEPTVIRNGSILIVGKVILRKGE